MLLSEDERSRGSPTPDFTTSPVLNLVSGTSAPKYGSIFDSESRSAVGSTDVCRNIDRQPSEAHGLSVNHPLASTKDQPTLLSGSSSLSRPPLMLASSVTNSRGHVRVGMFWFRLQQLLQKSLKVFIVEISTTNHLNFTRTACKGCRQRHLACGVERPCIRCVSLNLDCVNGEHKKRGRPRIKNRLDQSVNPDSPLEALSLPHSLAFPPAHYQYPSHAPPLVHASYSQHAPNHYITLPPPTTHSSLSPVQHSPPALTHIQSENPRYLHGQRLYRLPHQNFLQQHQYYSAPDWAYQPVSTSEFRFDVDLRGAILSCPDETAALFGLSRKDIEKSSIYKLFQPDCIFRFQRALDFVTGEAVTTLSSPLIISAGVLTPTVTYRSPHEVRLVCNVILSSGHPQAFRFSLAALKVLYPQGQERVHASCKIVYPSHIAMSSPPVPSTNSAPIILANPTNRLSSAPPQLPSSTLHHTETAHLLPPLHMMLSTSSAITPRRDFFTTPEVSRRIPSTLKGLLLNALEQEVVQSRRTSFQVSMLVT